MGDSADKRTVATDALETLGTIIDENQRRDCIHLAVEPVIAGETLRAGQYVYLLDGKAYAAHNDKGLGIVDPFLDKYEQVKRGDRFWLVVHPRQITSLRHVWEHPAFPPSGETDMVGLSSDERKAKSEKWLRSFIANADCPDYETVIAKALHNDESWDPDEYLMFKGSDAHGEIPLEFWDHVEIVTGKTITSRPKHFTCSC